MADIKKVFSISNDNIDVKKSSAVKTLTYEDIAIYEEDRQKSANKVENANTTKLKVDYSNFASHVFFDSATQKATVAKNKLINDYPYNGNTQDKDLYFLSGTAYEEYFFDAWPKSTGYAYLSSPTKPYISASDDNSALYIGSSSFCVSLWIKPYKAGNVYHGGDLVQHFSQSVSAGKKYGYKFYLSGNDDLYIKFKLFSGSTSYALSAAYKANGVGLTSSNDWHNVGFAYNSDLSDAYVFLDGNIATSSLGNITLNSIEYVSTPFFVGSGSSTTAGEATAVFSGSIDDIRVFFTASTDLYRNTYNRTINEEDYVKLHYKLNEGITGNDSTDSVVIDYSKSALHGVIKNYDNTVRFTGSAFSTEVADPILYTTHSDVIAFTSSIMLSASVFDGENRNYILRLVPAGVLEKDDDEQQLLTYYLLGLARYFDELKLYVDQFDNFKNVNYDDYDESPDVFLPFIQKYFGWKLAEQFGSDQPLPFFFGENIVASGSIEYTLEEIRNQFWRRLLNNIPYIYKSKGTKTSINALTNVFGINKNVLKLKEYGNSEVNSITNDIVSRQKVLSFLNFGKDNTTYTTGSYVKVSSFIGSTALSEYTVEATVQLPSDNSIYGSGSNLSGSIFQFMKANQSDNFSLIWTRDAVNKFTGSLILSESTVGGTSLKLSNAPIFSGNFVHLAAGRNASGQLFISYRTLDKDTIVSSGSTNTVGSVAGNYTGNSYDFIIGAQSASYNCLGAEGYLGQVRYWTRTLSASELEMHTLNMESVGINNVLELPYPLSGSWDFGGNYETDATGTIVNVQDSSGKSFNGKGYFFHPSAAPYQKFECDINYISPSYDLKWTEDKIKIKNKTGTNKSDYYESENQVTLEFSLVDSLNEDISKIITNLDFINNVVGDPVNKYRSNYFDLESYRRVYFNRLSDKLNFNRFFKLFDWFDIKIGNAIKQLLPAKSRFNGGEFVVENHLLERNKYQYKYPVFKTPKDISTGSLNGYESVDSEKSTVLSADNVSTTFSQKVLDENSLVLYEGQMRYTTSPVFSSSLTSSYVLAVSGTGVDGAITVTLTASAMAYDRSEHTTELFITYDTKDISDPVTSSNFASTFTEYGSDTITTSIAITGSASTRFGSIHIFELGPSSEISQYLSTSNNIPLFDNPVHIAYGVNSSQKAFVSCRVVRSGSILYSGHFTSSVAFSGAWISGNLGTEISVYPRKLWEYRNWTRELTSTELDKHASNHVSVEIDDPSEIPNPLFARYKFDENNEFIFDGGGSIFGYFSESVGGFTATGSGAATGNYNPYVSLDFYPSFTSSVVLTSSLDSNISATEKSYVEDARLGQRFINNEDNSYYSQNRATSQFRPNIVGNTHFYSSESLGISVQNLSWTPSTGSILLAFFRNNQSGSITSLSQSGVVWEPVLTSSYTEARWIRTVLVPLTYAQIVFTGSGGVIECWKTNTVASDAGSALSASLSVSSEMSYKDFWVVELISASYASETAISTVEYQDSSFIATSAYMQGPSIATSRTYEQKIAFLTRTRLTGATGPLQSAGTWEMIHSAGYVSSNSLTCSMKSALVYQRYNYNASPTAYVGTKTFPTSPPFSGGLDAAITVSFMTESPAPSVLPIKVSGDHPELVAHSENSINYRNLFLLDMIQKLEATEFDFLSGTSDFLASRTGSLIKSKLKRAGDTRSIDLSKEQSHFFSNNRKILPIELRAYQLESETNPWVDFSIYAGLDEPTTNQFSLTGADIYYAYTYTFDINGVAYSENFTSPSGEVPWYFNSQERYNYTTYPIYLPEKTFTYTYEVSGSSGTVYFDSEYKVSLCREDSGGGTSSVVFDPDTLLFLSESLDGWRAYRAVTKTDGGTTVYSYPHEDFVNPPYYASGTLAFKIETTNINKIYSFRNLKVDAFLPLLNEDVVYLRNLDNQNTEKICENINTNLVLNDFSEFPHSMGIYQMPSLIIGTVDTGKVGKDDDSIVQLTYIGSIVKIMWPRQDSDDLYNSKGFGDLAPGQRPGKLSTDFIAGQFYDVESLDVNHLSLYCYARKEQTGTADKIIVRIERRPLNSAPFTTEQSIVYATSGSYVDAQMKDLIYTKEIDYSDLSNQDIGYVIDIPLQNTKEIRISARQQNGQAADENKNFIVWGRFLNNNKDTV